MPRCLLSFAATTPDYKIAVCWCSQDTWSFITCHLNYCNALFSGRRSDRMTPILCQLHWLPVRQRITFKTAVLVYKCRHGMAPPYCEPTSSHGGRCHLRSAESGQLTVPRTRTNYGDRSFAVHGPVVWNSLPADLRLLNISLPVFRKHWKCSCSRITVIVQRLTWRICCVAKFAPYKCH